ncbi:MAG TPA: putative Ig domain-containing protein [Acidobacteriaceae bacterium]
MLKKATLSAAAVLWALFFFVGCGDPTTVNNASPVTITTSTLASGTVGVTYSASLGASGGTTPYTFSLASGSLPGGLTLTSAGVLSGTPTGAGTFAFTVTAMDAKGQRSPAASLSVSMVQGVAITTTSLPDGKVATAYTATIAATSGTTPYTFTITSGGLPPGLTIAPSTGAITGTPTTAGLSNFVVTVTDKNGGTANKALSINVAALTPITLSPLTLPAGIVNTAYTSTTLSATGGTAPYTYTVTTGTLPAGITLSPAGVLAGTPTAAGSFPIVVTATDNTSRTGTASYTITVTAAPVITISPTTLNAGSVGSPYTSVQFSAANGATPYTWAETGTLPTGITLSPGGLLSGTPTVPGSFPITVTATDKNSQTGSANYTLVINTASATLTLASPNLGALVNASYNATLAIAGGTAPYTVTRTGNLPNGISLSSSGVFSGTATATGSFPFSITVKDSSAPQLSQTFNVILNVVNATIAVDTTVPGITVPAQFYGLHTALYDNQMTDTAAIASKMATAGVNTLRYPGGGLADNYHWAQHSMTPFSASFPANCTQLPDAYISPTATFATFVKLLQASNAQAVITVNYGNSVADANASKTSGSDGSGTGNNYCSNPNKPGQPQEAAAWVAYANGSPSDTHVIGLDAAGFDWKTTGFWATMRAANPLGADDGYNFLRIGQTAPLGIKYWEVGNEIYYNGWSGPNPESDTHAPYVYPSGFGSGYTDRTGVAALSPTSYGQNAAAYVSAMKAVDPSILIGLTYDLPGTTDPINPVFNEQLTQAACSATSFDFVITHYYPGSYFGGAQPGELLSLPQFDLPIDVLTGGTSGSTAYKGIKPLLQQYCSNAANIQLLMTETSPNNSLAAGFPAPVIGLFVAHEMLESMSLGYQNFDWLELHASTTQANYMDNTFLDSSENPGPSFYGIQMAHTLATPNDTLVSSASTPASTASTGIISWATLKADGTKGVLLINADPTNTLTTQVTVKGATLGSTATQYTFGINNTTLTTTPNVPITGQSFPVSVPPYTAVELIIQ